MATLKLEQAIMTQCPCYRAGQYIKVKGLMLHSVGCAQPNAQVFIRTFSSPNYGAASVHGFIDGNTGIAYQTLPWNMLGWHCGGTANGTHIGIEMCEPSGIRYVGGSSFVVTDRAEATAVAKRTYDTAVLLFAYLCKQYGLDPLTQIVSHNEGYRKGIASGHADPEHLWRGLGLSYTMDGFRADVKKAMGGNVETTQPTQTEAQKQTTTTSGEMYRIRKSWNDAKSQIGAYRNLDGAKAACKAGYTVYDSKGKAVYTAAGEATPAKSTGTFLVRVSINDLNIRKGPGTNYGINGVIKPGVYTITATDGDWRKLKSGAGWISLNYAARL